MECRRKLITAFAGICLGCLPASQANAQRFYTGSSPSQAMSPRSNVVNGYYNQPTAPFGRPMQQYSANPYGMDDYGRQSGAYGVPGHFHGGGYSAGGYYPGGYTNWSHTNGLGFGVGTGGYSTRYYSVDDGYGSGVGYGYQNSGIGVGYGVGYSNWQRPVIVSGGFPATTVLNNSTRGGVIEYTHNGNGYIYTPGSSTQSVITTGASLYPSTTIVQPAEPPVIIETRPTTSNRAMTFQNGIAGSPPQMSDIKLVYPRTARGPLSYSLNGTLYTIKPGYSQTFADDRAWTIEFLQAGHGSQARHYSLKGGTFTFTADENGWDLTQPQTNPSIQLPPPPLPPAPTPSGDF